MSLPLSLSLSLSSSQRKRNKERKKVAMRVSALAQPRGRFLMIIGGTDLRVDTDAEDIEQNFDQLLDETLDNMVVFPGGTDYRSIVGLKITPVSAADPRPAVLQLCVGRRCILLPLLNLPRLPVALPILLTSHLLLKIIGMPGGAACFSGLTVRCEDPWKIAEDNGRPELLKNANLDSLAVRLMGAVNIIRPPVEEFSPVGVWDQWPPTPARVANLCADAYLLGEVGRRLILGASPC